MKKQLKPIENDISYANAKAFEKLGFLNRLDTGAIERLNEIKELDKEIGYTKLVCVHTNGKVFDFNIFKRLGGFTRSIRFNDFIKTSSG